MLVHEFSLRGAYAPLVSRWCLRRTPSRLGSGRRGDLAIASRDRELSKTIHRPPSSSYGVASRGHRGRRKVNDATMVRCLRVLRACQAVAVRRRLVLCGENLLKSEILRIRNNLRVLGERARLACW